MSTTAPIAIRSTLLNALLAERLKLKNTLAAWLVLIAPAVVVALQTCQWLLQKSPPVPAGTSAAETWHSYAHSALAIWSFLMLPLYVTLQSALLAAVDHQERQWKHLLALPIARRHIYLAKLLTLGILLALAMLVLVLVLLPVGGLLLHLRADIPIAGAPDWLQLLKKTSLVYACALFLIALHCFIALRWKSFTVAVAIGMSATVMGFIIGQSKEYGAWFPWTMPIQPLTANPNLTLVLLTSFLGALLVSILAILEFNRREFFD